MQASQVPAKIPEPFANQQSTTYNGYPLADTVSGNGASWRMGWGAVNATATAGGGVPPSVQDFNAILQQISAGVQWGQAGGGYNYDASYASTIGGYPLGAMLRTSTYNLFYINTVDNNTTNPTTGGAGWSIVKMIPQFNAVAPTQTVVAGASIGPFYSNTISLTFTAPFAGFVVSSAYLNTGAVITGGGLITVTLSNSTGGSGSADQTPVSQTHKQVFTVTAGTSVTMTLQVSSNSGTWPAVSCTYQLDYFFVPNY